MKTGRYIDLLESCADALADALAGRSYESLERDGLFRASEYLLALGFLEHSEPGPRRPMQGSPRVDSGRLIDRACNELVEIGVPLDYAAGTRSVRAPAVRKEALAAAARIRELHECMIGETTDHDLETQRWAIIVHSESGNIDLARWPRPLMEGDRLLDVIDGTIEDACDALEAIQGDRK